MGRNGEFGPLDAQIHDFEREQRISALEVTQSLERLNAEALQAVDTAMVWWGRRSGKKIDTLLPIATDFVSKMMQPLFDKIDAVHFTKMARVLKVAMDYATRLLMCTYDRSTAEQAAQVLTEVYSDHGFVVDLAELRRIGLKICETDDETEQILGPLVAPFFCGQHDSFLGVLREEPSHAPPAESTHPSNEQRPQRKPRARRGKRNQSDEAISKGELGAVGESDL